MKGKNLVLAYNEMFEPIGYVERKTANRTGLWHGCVQVWLISRRKNGSVIFQKRSSSKSVSPSFYDVSASGHIDEDNLPIETAIRETKEELGILVNENDLIYAGRRLDMFVKGNINSKIFAHVYFVINDTPLNEFKIDKHELDGVLEIPVDRGLKLFSQGYEATINKVKLMKPNLGIQEVKLTHQMFIPRYDFYYLKVCLAARQILNGEHSIVAI